MKDAKYRHFFYLPSTEDEVVYISPHSSETIEVYNLLFSARDECDSNHNSKLDKSEATAKKCGFTEEEFLEADTNKDGQFEYKDIELIYKAKLFYEVDKDGNGKLDFDEWVERW